MDNWGEGVVPSCREEQVTKLIFDLNWFAFRFYHFLKFSIEEIPAPIDVQTPDEIDQLPRPSSSSSQSDITNKQPHSADEHYEFLWEKETVPQRKAYNHDILVIDTQPPKVEEVLHRLNRCFHFRCLAWTISWFIFFGTSSNE